MAFPLTRPIAQRRARDAFDLCAGFVYSQVLYACVDLQLFDVLAERPQTLPVLARRLKLSEDRALRLLDAARALELVARQQDGRFVLGDLGAAIAGNPAILAMVAHHRLLYADLADPVGLLRGTRGETALARFWAYAGGAPSTGLDDARVRAYSALMSSSQSLVAGDILAAYDFGRHRRLLDIGGGQGTFVTAVAARVPALAFTVFDLPAVAERARERVAADGLAHRVAVQGGDFFADPLPAGADVATLVRVLHDHDDDRARALLAAARRALPPGGALVVAEPLAEAPGAAPMGAAYFGWYLLAMGQGRPRTGAEIATLMREAGFADAAQVLTRMPLQTGLVVGHRGG
jgi:demethylspheroidene O-methyltransferase